MTNVLSIVRCATSGCDTELRWDGPVLRGWEIWDGYVVTQGPLAGWCDDPQVGWLCPACAPSANP